MSHRSIHFLVIAASVILFIAGCTEGNRTGHIKSNSDTLYTEAKAMRVFAYQPDRALQIIDSAVIVGNIKEHLAERDRARIYSYTLMGVTVDSLLHGAPGVRFDSACVIGERLLSHDSAQTQPRLRQDILEILTYSARQQGDTLRWLMWARQLVEVCNEIGDKAESDAQRTEAETDALRTEAEIGAALFHMGQREQGMAKLDSVIGLLDNGERQFNRLDATIIAMKRKIGVLQPCDKDTTHHTQRASLIISLAQRIIGHLNDYEQHPYDYHDGSWREPNDSTARADYIRFYQDQAQNFIIATYAMLGDQGSMADAFTQMECSIREAAEREHVARYSILEQEMLRSRAESHSHQMTIIAISSAAVMLLLLIFALYTQAQKQLILQKNRALVRQINEAIKYKEMYEQQQTPAEETSGTPAPSLAALSDDELFIHLSEAIAREHLYLDASLSRQTLMDRFQLSKERIGNAFSRGSRYASMAAFIRDLRLQHAFHLLTDEPSMPIEQVAAASGYAITDTFTRNFKAKYGMTPTEFKSVKLTDPHLTPPCEGGEKSHS